MFQQSDVLFLSKPLKKDEKENKRKMISVDISNERKGRTVNSKTLDTKKKIFKRKFKKKLKLVLRKSIKTIYEVPTLDRELNEIWSEANR
jgi:hypothetical protein